MNFKYSTESTHLVLGAVGLCPAHGQVLWILASGLPCPDLAEAHATTGASAGTWVHAERSEEKRPFLQRSTGAEDENCPLSWHTAGSSVCSHIYTGWLSPKEEGRQRWEDVNIKDPAGKRKNNATFGEDPIEEEFLIAPVLWKIKQELGVNNGP